MTYAILNTKLWYLNVLQFSSNHISILNQIPVSCVYRPMQAIKKVVKESSYR